MKHTPILIVGGSLVGLSAALFLSWRGIPCILIEKHQGSSPHPRATGFTEHTLEYFRAVGIADQVPQVDSGTRLRRVKAESLSGRWHEETPWTPGEDGSFGQKASPCRGAAMAQDLVEPILRKAALNHGADLRLGVEMRSVVQSDDGIIAQVHNRNTGENYTIHADYLIAADGVDSSIRETLGIARRGVGYLRTLRSVIFRCAEADTFLDRGVQQFQIDAAGFTAFLTSYGDGRWVLMFDDDQERSKSELADSVRKALGREMEFELLATGRWEMAGRIADQYSQGRIFLVGDAAHQLPPTRGGFGANTGIDDAYNLAWKLEWVVSGRSMPALLATYNEERQPIGWLRHQQTFIRPDYARWLSEPLDNEILYSDEAMELGQLLRSTAIIGAESELPPAALPSEWRGHPGVRAPHAWIKKNGETISTIDLFTRRFTLISSDDRWIEAAERVVNEISIEIDIVQVGKDVTFSTSETFEQLFGVAFDGVSLVRPDGVVTWRSIAMTENPAQHLKRVLVQVAALKK